MSSDEAVDDPLERRSREQEQLIAHHRVETRLPVGPAGPALARAALARWLTGHVPPAMLDDARLLASELVTNSLDHADLTLDPSLRIAAQLAHGALRVEVRDAGSTGTIAPRTGDLVHGGGFGLQLVAALSSRWGVDRAGGTQVWFEMDGAFETG